MAEAANVIANTTRDANIAMMNEFALIFDHLDIDTQDVLAAAGTKWNFLPFKPGLVSGHCIGVDPYYQIQKAQSVGYYPDILLACRRINDDPGLTTMGQHVAAEVVKLMIHKGHAIAGARVLAARLHVQGELPRPAQHPRDRPGARAARIRRHGRCLRSLGRPRRRSNSVALPMLSYKSIQARSEALI